MLQRSESRLNFFTFTGAVLGLIAGFALTIYTSLSWPIQTSGKPIISLPPFIIIAFELTILFGAIASFLGFLILTGLPQASSISSPIEHENQFVILERIWFLANLSILFLPALLEFLSLAYLFYSFLGLPRKVTSR